MVLTNRVSNRSTVEAGLSPSVRRRSVNTATQATTGIVKPIERRAEHQVDAVLQPVEKRGPHRGDALRQENERGDDDTHERRGKTGKCDGVLQRMGQDLRQQDDDQQRDRQHQRAEHGYLRGRQFVGNFLHGSSCDRLVHEIVAMLDRLDEDEDAIKHQRHSADHQELGGGELLRPAGGDEIGQHQHDGRKRAQHSQCRRSRIELECLLVMTPAAEHEA
ncbi:MAG: hypothetical protein ABS57_17915 [Mesorhizobium sp. SCN 65-12]|nr:MAG: hypothetical protein ABS57_17915 [Mesorhizobium sp. SCN 65-12]